MYWSYKREGFNDLCHLSVEMVNENILCHQMTALDFSIVICTYFTSPASSTTTLFVYDHAHTQSQPGRDGTTRRLWCGMTSFWLVLPAVSLVHPNIDGGILICTELWTNCNALWTHVISGNSHRFTGHWQSHCTVPDERAVQGGGERVYHAQQLCTLI